MNLWWNDQCTNTALIMRCSCSYFNADSKHISFQVIPKLSTAGLVCVARGWVGPWWQGCCSPAYGQARQLRPYLDQYGSTSQVRQREHKDCADMTSRTDDPDSCGPLNSALPSSPPPPPPHTPTHTHAEIKHRIRQATRRCCPTRDFQGTDVNFYGPSRWVGSDKLDEAGACTITGFRWNALKVLRVLFKW